MALSSRWDKCPKSGRRVIDARCNSCEDFVGRGPHDEVKCNVQKQRQFHGRILHRAMSADEHARLHWNHLAAIAHTGDEV